MILAHPRLLFYSTDCHEINSKEIEKVSQIYEENTKVEPSNSTRKDENEDDIQVAYQEHDGNGWWSPYCSEKDTNKIGHSGKLIALFSIINELKDSADKIIVFSRNPLSLDVIEYFLALIDDETRNSNGKLQDFTGLWKPGYHYYRVDESTNMESYSAYFDIFNNAEHTHVKFVNHMDTPILSYTIDYYILDCSLYWLGIFLL